MPLKRFVVENTMFAVLAFALSVDEAQKHPTQGICRGSFKDEGNGFVARYWHLASGAGTDVVC